MLPRFRMFSFLVVPPVIDESFMNVQDFEVLFFILYIIFLIINPSHRLKYLDREIKFIGAIHSSLLLNVV